MKPSSIKPSESNLKARAIFIIVMLFCLMPFMTPPAALLAGLILAQVIDHPFQRLSEKATAILLKISVIGLGFGMNLFGAIKAGREGILLTTVSITVVFFLGAAVRKLMTIERKTSFLISAGTAICGGSAIAALSPVVKAGEKQISVALGTVFILNSVALFLFPAIGHALHLSESQFGIWCAIAIHDTSSVVGAASRYGSSALQIATTVKLARALWIIPVALASSFFFKSEKRKIKLPYFIGLFVIAMLANTYIPAIHAIAPHITSAAKAGLTLTLFLIGSGLSFKSLKTVGIKPLIEGIILWICISAGSLLLIMNI